MLRAQELSPISPRKVAAWLKPADTIRTIQLLTFQLMNTRHLMSIPLRLLSDHDDFHVHVFMSLAADDRADNPIFSRFGGHTQDKFLDAGLEFKIPARDFRAILLADEREAVNGSVSVEGLRLLSSDSELYFFACLEGKRGTHLATDLVTAVLVGQDFNHAHLGLRGASRTE